MQGGIAIENSSQSISQSHADLQHKLEVMVNNQDDYIDENQQKYIEGDVIEKLDQSLKKLIMAKNRSKQIQQMDKRNFGQKMIAVKKSIEKELMDKRYAKKPPTMLVFDMWNPSHKNKILNIFSGSRKNREVDLDVYHQLGLLKQTEKKVIELTPDEILDLKIMIDKKMMKPNTDDDYEFEEPNLLTLQKTDNILDQPEGPNFMTMRSKSELKIPTARPSVDLLKINGSGRIMFPLPQVVSEVKIRKSVRINEISDLSNMTRDASSKDVKDYAENSLAPKSRKYSIMLPVIPSVSARGSVRSQHGTGNPSPAHSIYNQIQSQDQIEIPSPDISESRPVSKAGRKSIRAIFPPLATKSTNKIKPSKFSSSLPVSARPSADLDKPQLRPKMTEKQLLEYYQDLSTRPFDHESILEGSLSFNINKLSRSVMSEDVRLTDKEKSIMALDWIVKACEQNTVKHRRPGFVDKVKTRAIELSKSFKTDLMHRPKIRKLVMHRRTDINAELIMRKMNDRQRARQQDQILIW